MADAEGKMLNVFGLDTRERLVKVLASRGGGYGGCPGGGATDGRGIAVRWRGGDVGELLRGAGGVGGRGAGKVCLALSALKFS